MSIRQSNGQPAHAELLATLYDKSLDVFRPHAFEPLGFGISSAPMQFQWSGEFTMLELAEVIIEMTGSTSELVFEALPQDDPSQRRPDTTIAREVLGWEATTSLEERQ